MPVRLVELSTSAKRRGNHDNHMSGNHQDTVTLLINLKSNLP